MPGQAAEQTRGVIFVIVFAVWIVLSLLVGLAVIALCRAGHAEDEQWAVMDPVKTWPRRGRPSSGTTF